MSISEQRKGIRPIPTPIIHVVDDDESFRTAITRLLRATNYEVRTYANANDFLVRYIEGAPGCILLDLRMPGLSGLDLQEVLTARAEQLPIIFLSGHGDIRATTRAIRKGAIAFLHKPVQTKDLLEAIGTALDCNAVDRVERLRQITYEFRTGATPANQPRA